MINHVAMQKILKKFVKEHFEFKDNIIEKTLVQYINKKPFSSRGDIQYLIQDLKLFYADSFTGGDETKAKNILEQNYTEIRRADALKISFWTGGSMVMTMFTIFFLFIPTSNGE